MFEMIKESAPVGWLIIIAIAAIAAVVVKAVLNFIIGKLKGFVQNTSTRWDDITAFALSETKVWAIFIVVLSALSPVLNPPPSLGRAVHIALILGLALQVSIWGLCSVRRWRDGYIEARYGANLQDGGDMSLVAVIGLVGTALQALILIAVILVAMSNLGIDVMALVAGLGVGGIAVALAAQNVLGDILASLSIVLDKPFVVGDFIAVGDRAGTVENIGLKTTRLRSLSGEQLVFSNKDLLESRVQNFKRMSQRRVANKFGVLYSTPADTLEKIPLWIKDLITENPVLRFDRCHFAGYGDSSLDFEYVFYVLDKEFNVYMDNQQKLLLAIFRKFEAEKVDFAFPTRTLHIENVPERLADRI